MIKEPQDRVIDILRQMELQGCSINTLYRWLRRQGYTEQKTLGYIKELNEGTIKTRAHLNG